MQHRIQQFLHLKSFQNNFPPKHEGLLTVTHELTCDECDEELIAEGEVDFSTYLTENNLMCFTEQELVDLLEEALTKIPR